MTVQCRVCIPFRFPLMRAYARAHATEQGRYAYPTLGAETAVGQWGAGPRPKPPRRSMTGLVGGLPAAAPSGPGSQAAGAAGVAWGVAPPGGQRAPWPGGRGDQAGCRVSLASLAQPGNKETARG